MTAWCVDKQLRLAVMQGHRARVTGVAYIPQHGQFATCSFDKTVRLWDADRFKPIVEVRTQRCLPWGLQKKDLLQGVRMQAPIFFVHRWRNRNGRWRSLKGPIVARDAHRMIVVQSLSTTRVVDSVVQSQHGSVSKMTGRLRSDRTIFFTQVCHPFAPVSCVRLTRTQMKRRSPIKHVESRGDLILCVTLEVEAHVSGIEFEQLYPHSHSFNNCRCATLEVFIPNYGSALMTAHVAVLRSLGGNMSRILTSSGWDSSTP